MSPADLAALGSMRAENVEALASRDRRKHWTGMLLEFVSRPISPWQFKCHVETRMVAADRIESTIRTWYE